MAKPFGIKFTPVHDAARRQSGPRPVIRVDEERR